MAKKSSQSTRGHDDKPASRTASGRYRVQEVSPGRYAVYDHKLTRYASGVLADRDAAEARACKLGG